jgi:hypothetical protein
MAGLYSALGIFVVFGVAAVFVTHPHFLGWCRNGRDRYRRWRATIKGGCKKGIEVVQKILGGGKKKDEEGAQGDPEGDAERKGSQGGVSTSSTVVEDKDEKKKESTPRDDESGKEKGTSGDNEGGSV